LKTKRSPANAKAGYALPAVLTVVTVLTLIFMVCIQALVNLRQETEATLRDAELERAALTAEARVELIVTTEPLGANAFRVGDSRNQGLAGVAGIVSTPNASNTPADPTELLLDDHPYSWSEGEGESKNYIIRIQDLAGLINLDRINNAQLTNLLTLIGVPPDSIQSAVNNFMEYRSPVTQQLGERESGSIIRPLAPDALMRQSSEVYGVPDFLSVLTPAQRRRFLNLTYVAPDTVSININTATPESLETWYGASEVDAAEILKRRESEIFYSPTQVGLGSPNDDGVYTFPSGRVRFTFVAAGGRYMYRANIVLTPSNLYRPFFIEDARAQPSDEAFSTEVNGLKPLPTPPLTPDDGRRSP
jgi:ribosomal protein L27